MVLRSLGQANRYSRTKNHDRDDGGGKETECDPQPITLLLIDRPCVAYGSDVRLHKLATDARSVAIEGLWCRPSIEFIDVDDDSICLWAYCGGRVAERREQQDECHHNDRRPQPARTGAYMDVSDATRERNTGSNKYEGGGNQARALLIQRLGTIHLLLRDVRRSLFKELDVCADVVAERDFGRFGHRDYLGVGRGHDNEAACMRGRVRAAAWASCFTASESRDKAVVSSYTPRATATDEAIQRLGQSFSGRWPHWWPQTHFSDVSAGRQTQNPSQLHGILEWARFVT